MNRFKASAAALCLAAAAFVGAPAAQAQSPLSLASLLSIDPVPPSNYGRAAPETAPIPREIVNYPTRHAPGTIIVSSTERRLYLVLVMARRSAMALASAGPASNGRASSASR